MTRARTPIITLVLGLLPALAGCGDETTGRPGEGPVAEDESAEGDTVNTQTSEGEEEAGDSQGEPPGQQGEGQAEYPRARQIARLSADQFHAALQVATGQAWAGYDTYAAALGKPDLAEVTEQSRSFSVSFDKFAHDAARSTCRAAVEADLGAAEGGDGDGDGDGGEALEGVILRYASASDRSQAAYLANLQYLMLRFLVIEVDEDDERLDPWINLLNTPAPADEELTDELMADRWWAVCVGLATHPDFLSY